MPKQKHIEQLITYALTKSRFFFGDLPTTAPIFNYDSDEVEITVLVKNWVFSGEKKQRLERHLKFEMKNEYNFRVDGSTYYIPFEWLYYYCDCNKVANRTKEFMVAIEPIDKNECVHVLVSFNELKYECIESAFGHREREDFDSCHYMYSEKFKTEIKIFFKGKDANSDWLIVQATRNSKSSLSYNELTKIGIIDISQLPLTLPFEPYY
ncbi:hypothetical protein [Pontibacter sp. H249]|uniref:hypothetical protein n=1 Tax=Pontibacter sp. H249 TaxID=3133420 RepID=UPI0030C43924